MTAEAALLLYHEVLAELVPLLLAPGDDVQHEDEAQAVHVASDALQGHRVGAAKKAVQSPWDPGGPPSATQK